MQDRNADAAGARASNIGGRHGEALGHSSGPDARFASQKAASSSASSVPSSRDASTRYSHPRMPMSERAKIFVPFNPLKGFSEALRTKEREAEAAALDDRGGNDLEAPDEATTLEEYLTAEDVADGAGPWGGVSS